MHCVQSDCTAEAETGYALCLEHLLVAQAAANQRGEAHEGRPAPFIPNPYDLWARAEEILSGFTEDQTRMKLAARIFASLLDDYVHGVDEDGKQLCDFKEMVDPDENTLRNIARGALRSARIFWLEQTIEQKTETSCTRCQKKYPSNTIMAVVDDKLVCSACWRPGVDP